MTNTLKLLHSVCDELQKAFDKYDEQKVAIQDLDYWKVEVEQAIKQIELNCKDKNICVCGGKVSTVYHGEDSWTTSCEKCGYLYDED